EPLIERTNNVVLTNLPPQRPAASTPSLAARLPCCRQVDAEAHLLFTAAGTEERARNKAARRPTARILRFSRAHSWPIDSQAQAARPPQNAHALPAIVPPSPVPRPNSDAPWRNWV